MICPRCNNENLDSAKFCRKCGAPLIESESRPASPEKSFFEKNKILILCIAIIAVVAIAAGVFVFSMNNNAHSEPAQANQTSVPVVSSESTASSSAPQRSSSPLQIIGGSISTGSELEDKTYASIYVGSEHAGEQVVVQIYYSRDGTNLNNGNMVPVTVDSSGYVSVSSADAYQYFPDHADIYLYDANQNLKDTMSVYLSPSAGTQTF